MYDLIYVDTASTSTYCYDATYNDANTYAGYYDSSQWYAFDTGTGKFITTSAPASGSCNNQETYVCVDINTSVSPQVLNTFKATGKFLNWLSASKFDVEKQILTGGKNDAGAQALVAESRGCFGRSFIKGLTDTNFKVSFGVRGPQPRWCTTSRATCTTNADCLVPGDTCDVNMFAVSTGGQTYIDILSGKFNSAVCQDAVNYAMTGNSLGQLKGKIDACLTTVNGSNQTGGQTSVNQNGAFNQSVQSCWHGSAGSWGHQNSLSNMCDKIYPNVDALHIPISSRASVCSYAFIGKCYVDNGNSWPGSDTCFQAQMDLFCGNFSFPEVIDPSGTISDTQQNGNIPGMLMASAADSELGSAVGTFPVRVDTTTLTASTPLILKYADRIRFGVMAFNDLGSKTECASFPNGTEQRIGYYCNQIGAADKDGTKITAAIGSDTATVINSINNLTAKTWTPYAEGFFNAIAYFTQNTDPSSALPHRLNDTDFDTSVNPIQYKCQANNVLLISDGESTTDQNAAVNTFVSTNAAYRDGDSQYTSSLAADSTVVPLYFGSKNLDDLAWYAQHKNIFNPTQPVKNAKEIINTYVVYTGFPCASKAADGLTCTSTDESIAEVLMQQTAKDGGTVYQRAENPSQLMTALDQSFQTISAKAASGTAASVLASGEGSGANLVQAIFYPKTTVGTTQLTWIGSLKNLWYYIDPLLGNSSIREDTDSDKELALTDDNIVLFFFDSVNNLTKANLFSDANGDGVADSTTPTSTVYFEDVKNLWEAGKLLRETTNAVNRVIYTTTDGSNLMTFDTSSSTASTLRPYLQEGNNNLAGRLISYIRGTDYSSNFCSQTVTTTCTTDSNCPAGETCMGFRNRTASPSGTPYVYKLGDIINSTPRIVSSVAENTYYKTYSDSTYNDFISTADYKNRGMVFVGANDGMLHAFRLGTLTLFEEKNLKARLTGTTMGTEAWAFIPRNVLPYLKYIADPNYCHLYSVDATPYIVDASINGTYDAQKTSGSWKTILIGSMRFGGACRKTGDTCTNCVKTPILDPVDATKGLGYSTYFALDVTDTVSHPDDPSGHPPVLLWEFSNEALGFSTTGPAIVKISAKKADGSTDNTKNGKWFAVIGSGPTGPIDPNSHQFKGYSYQDLNVFILDLKTGQLLSTINAGTSLGLHYAFAGNMTNGAIDFNQNNPTATGFYQDEAVYFGYTQSENNPPNSSTGWNVGGVLRLLTKDSLNPADWALSKVIDGIGPITTTVAKLQSYTSNQVWLAFGTGRYYFKIGTSIDDQTTGRSLYGLKEPCYSSSGIDNSCTTKKSRSQLGDASNAASTDSDGWYINLDGCTDASGNAVGCSDASVVYKPERNVTDPITTPSGIVFFTTTKPAADVCQYGGASHLWAVNFNTGGAVKRYKLQGKALLQVSTGSIEMVDLKTAFTGRQDTSVPTSADNPNQFRRTDAVQGVPPAGAPPGILIPPPPVNKIFHIRER
jgi:type IV pilus assembly protein PilY1